MLKIDDFRKAERKIRLAESPQLIEPLQSDTIDYIRSWLEKLWKNKDKITGVNIKSVKGFSNVFQIEKVKYNSKKYNFIFQIINNECTFFSRYVFVPKLKNLPKASITQVLIWRNLDRADYSIDSFSVTKEIIFPITNSLLCDVQQTRQGAKAWDYIVSSFLADGCKCGIYDNTLKEFIPIRDYANDYKSNIGKYRGSSSDFQRYQICVYKD